MPSCLSVNNFFYFAIHRFELCDYVCVCKLGVLKRKHLMIKSSCFHEPEMSLGDKRVWEYAIHELVPCFSRRHLSRIRV